MRLFTTAVRRTVIRHALLSTLFAAPAFAAQAPAPAEPAPRDAQGHMLISWGPGQAHGLWYTDYGTRIPFFNVDEIAFKPWAKGLFDARQKHDLEPHARCKASGGIRQQLTPYGVEMLEIPALQKLFIFDIGGPHTYREIFMDGRSHPTDFEPTNYGHSIGWWDGDTLVIDSVGYNTDFWFERMGLPHTESVHVIEYYTRRNKNQMDYRFVMDDPTAYDKPVEGRARLNWRENEELFEYVCQQANYAQELMVNENREAIGRINSITP
ncbi:MAG: hypothetical protein LBF16_12080 [Pseudomonadales bacterium]|jgi:hypothetical protein|nr:hypothetical protein [Pseudomonadales bacterium]